jgi:hypothetical protein
MWPRVVEFLLGLWLGISPLLFHYPDNGWFLWWQTFLTAAAVMACSAMSIWRPGTRVHFVTAGLALWIIGLGYFGWPKPNAIVTQNLVGTGLLLLTVWPLPPGRIRRPARARPFRGAVLRSR